MANNLVRIFSICAIILGVYILVSALIRQEPSLSAKQYHIGCYLTNNSHSHHRQITKALNTLKYKKEKSRAELNIHRSLVLGNEDLRSKSVKIAKEFQNYIQKVAISGAYQKNNQEFYFQLQNSLSQYTQCKQQVSQNFNEKDCEDDWNKIKECSRQLQNHKLSIQEYVQKREVLSSNIKIALKENPTDSKNKVDKNALLDKIKEKFQRLNEQNDKQINSAQKQIINLYTKVEKQQEFLQKSRSQYSSVEKEYISCKSNLMEFSACQNLTSIINSYGYKGNLSDIKERLQKKKNTLEKMRQLMIGQNGLQKQQTKKMYDKGIIQFKQIQGLIINIHTQIDGRKCGCSKEEQGSLKFRKQKAESQIQSFEAQINVFNIRIQKQKEYLQQLKDKKLTLQNLKEKEIDEVIQKENLNEKSPSKLEEYNENLIIINQSILKFEGLLNSMALKCYQLKNRLSNKFKQIDSLKSCLLKRDYYLKLKSKANEILYKDESGEVAKNKLIKSLQEIEWKKAIQNKNQILNQITQEIGHLYYSQVTYEVVNQLLVQEVVQGEIGQFGQGYQNRKDNSWPNGSQL